MDAPTSVKSLVKNTICNKERFPYGDNRHETFYNPNCIEGMLTCKDICGNKCQKDCKIAKSHPDSCMRGKLRHGFVNCPMSRSEEVLNYVTYELVVDDNIKEGKKVYKKTDKVETEMRLSEFVARFTEEFPAFSKHTLEAWFLNCIKNAGFAKNNQPSHAMVCVSDFAQNLQVEKKHEVSEEYFHKTQFALFATVTSIVTEEEESGELERFQHTISQATSSMNKYEF